MSEKKIVKVLVASPSDVAAERKIADEVIRAWHIRHPPSGIMLEPVLWESHGASESGERVQGILNKQIVDACDCAIGIFWTRIGTDTGVAPGGAVEEVQRLMSKGKLVMFYFSDLPVPRRLMDLKQIELLEMFRESVQSHSLTWEYQEHHEFESLLSRHLDIQIPRWFGPDAAVQDRMVVLPELDAASALKLYQSTLKRQLGNVTLTGSPAITNFSVKLSDTFVSLSLSGSSCCETRHFAASEQCVPHQEDRTSTPEEVMSFVFQHHPLLLIIGDPGSGKTTLLKYYALSCLDNGRHKEFGFNELVNVFYLPLRELRKADTGYASLPATLTAWCSKNYLVLQERLFSDWLEESSTLVLFDGLDEISNVDDRISVCDWIDKMVDRFTKARFVVTSRSTGYRKGDGIELEASHRRADIMDFSKEQQVLFLQRWFKAAFLGEIPPGNGDNAEWRTRQEQSATKKADAILDFLAQEKNRSLQSLAGVPLLLQIMAMLWKDRQYLPGSRLKLYDAALNYMLDYRDRRRGIDPLLAAEDARRVLSPVSLWMQEELKQDEAGRETMQEKMQELLNTLYNSLSAKDFCRNLVDRAGLLVEYGEKEYVFRHKSFREYLAGVQLEKSLHRGGSLDELVTHFGDDWWQEPLRFFIGHVDDAVIFDSFMQKLFDSPVTENLTPKQQDLLLTLVEEAPQRKIDALKKKLLDLDTTPNRQRYIMECLKTIGKPEALAIVKKFHDVHATTTVLRDKLDAEYLLIKGGTFTFSLTQRPERVPDLFVAKYTVTNTHYRRFINYLAGQDLEFASELPLERYTELLQREAEKIKGFSDYLRKAESLSKYFTSYSDDDKRFNKDDQPVVGVSWYAAQACCLWLSLVESNGANTTLYRLPTEKEWEYVAGGKESRTYPWGSAEPSSRHANYNNNEGAPTPVGCYPDGATPEGLHDMAGNVWEWTADWYDKDEDDPAIRGGAYYSDKADALRCSSRDYGFPRYYDGFVGFRVIRSSPFSS